MTSLYRRFQSKRDSVLAKIDYVQAESARWRALFKALAAPYSVLRAMGLSPQLAATMLLAMIGGGSYVAVDAVMEGKSFSRGDAGVYLAPDDIPAFYDESDNTLLLSLGSVPVDSVSIDGVDVGTAYTGSTLPSGETNAVFVGGLPASAGFNETFLEIGHLTVETWRCLELTIEESEIYQLTVKWMLSDGQSMSAVPGTPRSRRVGGGNRADAMTTSGGYYDQVRIEAGTSGVNGQVDTMTLSNFSTAGGPCVISRIKAGVVDIESGIIGGDSDLATKALKIQSSVVFNSFTNTDNVEEAMAAP